MRRLRSVVLSALAALAVAGPVPVPAYAADPEHRVDARCDFAIFPLPNSFTVLLVVTAQAHASGHSTALTTEVTCTVTTARGEFVTTTAPAVGPDAWAASTGLVRLAAFSRCWSAQAMWQDVQLVPPALSPLHWATTAGCSTP